MPVTVLKVGLKDALPYPIQFYAKELIKHVINILLTVVSLCLYIYMFENYS